MAEFSPLRKSRTAPDLTGLQISLSNLDLLDDPPNDLNSTFPAPNSISSSPPPQPTPSPNDRANWKGSPANTPMHLASKLVNYLVEKRGSNSPLMAKTVSQDSVASTDSSAALAPSPSRKSLRGVLSDLDLTHLPKLSSGEQQMLREKQRRLEVERLERCEDEDEWGEGEDEHEHEHGHGHGHGHGHDNDNEDWELEHTPTTNTTNTTNTAILNTHPLPLKRRIQPQPQLQPPKHKHFNSWLSLTPTTKLSSLIMLLISGALGLLGPIRDGVAIMATMSTSSTSSTSPSSSKHWPPTLPTLTLISTLFALLSTVPISWLFESSSGAGMGGKEGGGKLGHSRIFARIGLTRGQNRGTSLKLFCRVFMACCVAAGVCNFVFGDLNSSINSNSSVQFVQSFSQIFFFLVSSILKLHATSLIWGVAVEGLVYEQELKILSSSKGQSKARTKAVQGPIRNTRLSSLSVISFSSTIGTLLGSWLMLILSNNPTKKNFLRFWVPVKIYGFLPSFPSLVDYFPSIFDTVSTNTLTLLFIAPTLFELGARYCGELGEVMDGYVNNIAAAPQTSTSKSTFTSNNNMNAENIRKVKSVGDLSGMDASSINLAGWTKEPTPPSSPTTTTTTTTTTADIIPKTRTQRYMSRLSSSVKTIVSSRLLLTTFTYNALFASSSTLLSFRRAEGIRWYKDYTNSRVDAAGHAAGDSGDVITLLATVQTSSTLLLLLFQLTPIPTIVRNRLQKLYSHYRGRGKTRGGEGRKRWVGGGEGILLLVVPLLRFLTSLLLLALSFNFHQSGGSSSSLITVTVLDELGRIVAISVTKATREGYLWNGVSSDVRVKTKPIVDTISNRWGGGVAAGCCWLLGGLHGDVTLVLLVGASLWWVVVGSDLVWVREGIDWEIEEMKRRERKEKAEAEESKKND